MGVNDTIPVGMTAKSPSLELQSGSGLAPPVRALARHVLPEHAAWSGGV
jgi:hypothetical protein